MLEIRQSNIHGVGLFTTEDIEANQKICDYIGEEMTITQFKQKYGNYNENCINTYRMKRIHKIIVAKEEPYKTNNLINYINEDKTNYNCILKRRALYSIRKIHKDEELTLKYPNGYKY
jgi:hypothetical protein